MLSPGPERPDGYRLYEQALPHLLWQLIREKGSLVQHTSQIQSFRARAFIFRSPLPKDVPGTCLTEYVCRTCSDQGGLVGVE